MNKISFIILGNPVPYLRMTQGQVRLMRIPFNKLSADGFNLRKRISRYLAYKDLVFQESERRGIDRDPKTKVYLNVMIYFENFRHGDPENIRKGIQDAIYTNDRMVAGNVDFDYDLFKPRVEVEIIQ